MLLHSPLSGLEIPEANLLSFSPAAGGGGLVRVRLSVLKAKVQQYFVISTVGPLFVSHPSLGCHGTRDIHEQSMFDLRTSSWGYMLSGAVMQAAGRARGDIVYHLPKSIDIRAGYRSCGLATCIHDTLRCHRRSFQGWPRRLRDVAERTLKETPQMRQFQGGEETVLISSVLSCASSGPYLGVQPVGLLVRVSKYLPACRRGPSVVGAVTADKTQSTA